MLTAIVLAGGRSSRMGRAKALLPFDGEPLIRHIVRQLKSQFEDVVVVAAPGQELPDLPARLVHDVVAYQGPVGGISYGLRAAAGEFAFVTSCDSAFLNRALVAHLLSLRFENDVVVPRWGGRLQPLSAIFRRSVLPTLEQQLADGQLRVVALFDKVRTRIVDEEEIRLFDPSGDTFFNMNTPNDYEEALRRWNASPGSPAERIRCTVELYGVARLVAQTREVSLLLPAGATIADALAALVDRLPVLAQGIVATDGTRLADGYACNVNGLDFVRDARTLIRNGDNIAIVSADAGG